MVSKTTLLRLLPEYRDSWVIIKDDQEVKDIIKEIQAAHKEFTQFYDQIALYFDASTVYQICEKLYWFCNDNIRYKEESEEFQTTALPTGILTRGFGDCKHYASFCGGVLDAINRLTGKNIDWSYRFASYKLFNWTPHHVFVVVRDGPYEIWIDPTPGSDNKNPTWLTDKKIKENMALYRNIAGMGNNNSLLLNASRPKTHKPAIGAIPWADVAQGALSIVTNIFGADKVPNYPVKETKTFNSLKSSLLNDWVGTVAPGGQFEVVPRSIDEAKTMLAKAIKRKQEEIDLGHGYSNGKYPGWDTLMMLYDETIKALELFIQAAGQISSTGTLPNIPAEYTAGANTGAGSSSSMTNTLLLLGGVGVVGYFLLNKNRKAVRGIDAGTGLLIGGGALLLFMIAKSANSSANAGVR